MGRVVDEKIDTVLGSTIKSNVMNNSLFVMLTEFIAE